MNIINVTGLVPKLSDGATALTNWSILQGIVDDPANALGALVNIPAGIFFVARPVIVDKNNFRFIGMGDGITVLNGTGGSHPVFMFGFPRNYVGTASGGKALSSADFQPLAGVLDKSVTSGNGFKLRKNLHLNIPWQAFSHPKGVAGWQGVTAFTLDLALDCGPNGFGGVSGQEWGPIAAIATDGNNPTPFLLKWVGNSFYFAYALEDGVARSFTVFDPAATKLTGVVRLSFQVDAGKGTFGAVINGKWVTGIRDNTTPAQQAVFAAGGHAFKNNYFAPMKFCGEGESDAGQTTWGMTDNFAFTLLGAKLSNTAKYSATALPGNDYATYFAYDANAIGYLPFNDDLAYLQSSRVVNIVNGPGAKPGSGPSGVGFLTDANCGNNWASTIQQGLSEMTVNAGSGYGITVCIGLCMSFQGKNLSISGGIALGNYRQGANYTASFNGQINLSGFLCPLLLSYATAFFMDSLNINGVGFCGIRSTNSTLSFNTLWFTGNDNSNTKWYIWADSYFGGDLITADNENNVWPATEAMLRFDLFPNIPCNVLKVNSVCFARVPRQASMVKLTAGGTPDNVHYTTRGVVDLANISCWDGAQFKAALEVTDRRFYGLLTTAWEPANPATPFLLAADNLCNVQVQHQTLRTLPTGGGWVMNCDELINLENTSGWTKAKCVGSGIGANAKWTIS